MAQVGVQQPTNLMEMFSSPSMMLGDIAAQQVNDQTLGNLINRQQAGQDMEIQQKKLPFELQQLGLQNQEAEARIPGVRAESGLKQNNLKVDTANLDTRIKADLSKRLADISDNEWTQHMNGIYQAMIDPSPQVRAVAQQLYSQLPEIVKMRQQEIERRETQIDVEGLRGTNALNLEAQAAGHGKYLKPFSAGIDLQIRAAKNPEEKMLKIQQAYQEATDETAKQHYKDLYDAIKPLYDNYMKAKAAGNAGKPDASALIGVTPVDIPKAPDQPGAPASSPEPQDKLQITPASVQQAFGSYEPNKYQYRINPATGKLQRKPI